MDACLGPTRRNWRQAAVRVSGETGNETMAHSWTASVRPNLTDAGRSILMRRRTSPTTCPGPGYFPHKLCCITRCDVSSSGHQKKGDRMVDVHEQTRVMTAPGGRSTPHEAKQAPTPRKLIGGRPFVFLVLCRLSGCIHPDQASPGPGSLGAHRHGSPASSFSWR